MSLNAHFSLPLLLSTNDSRSLYLPFPSIKYSSLKYKDSTPTSEYYGIALECGFIINKYSLASPPGVFFIPNLGVIWGKERENMRFSQFQLNVIPAAVLMAGIGLSLLSPDRLGRSVGGFVTVLSTSVLLDYSIAF